MALSNEKKAENLKQVDATETTALVEILFLKTKKEMEKEN